MKLHWCNLFTQHDWVLCLSRFNKFTFLTFHDLHFHLHFHLQILQEEKKKFLQEEARKLEVGQGRSEISKVDGNEDKATLSFNIPPDALKDLLKNYPDIKHQYENTSTQSLSENATNPSDSEMAAGNKEQKSPLKTQQALNDLSKLLTNQAAESQQNKSSSPQPSGTGESLGTTPKPDEILASNNQTMNIDKSLLVNTLQSLLQNNASLVNQDKKTSEINSTSLKNKESTGVEDSLPLSSASPSLLASLTNTSPSRLNIESLSYNNNSTKTNTTSLGFSPSSNNTEGTSSQTPSNMVDTQNTSTLNQAPSTLADSRPDSLSKDPGLMDEASKLSKEELLGVLKGVLSDKQKSSQTSPNPSSPTTSSINNGAMDYLNLPSPSNVSSSNSQPFPTTSTPQELSNDDITKGLKKLLGIKDKQVAGDNINTTTFNPDGSKFSKLIETCVRSSDDPKCLHGKIVTEGGYVPKPKSGVDETKQTISISPSSLVQRLMQHKQAEDSTPDAVENSSPSPTSSKDTPDHDRLISFLQNALTNKTTTTRQDVATTNNNSNKTMCNKLMKRQISNNKLMKRGFLIKYNCDGILSNYTHVGLTGKSPVSTSDLLKSLIKENPEQSRSLPPTHLQKTSNGFQVDFDLHVKDQIPKEVVSGTLKTLSNGRQQHINLYQTPNGVAMKPKSSVQLLKPQFVPVAQNRDNIELRKTEKKFM